MYVDCRVQNRLRLLRVERKLLWKLFFTSRTSEYAGDNDAVVCVFNFGMQVAVKVGLKFSRACKYVCVKGRNFECARWNWVEDHKRNGRSWV